MIKNVIFDVGKVLIDWNPEITMAAVGCTEEEISEIHKKIFDSGLWNEEDKSAMSKEELADLFSAELPGLEDKFRAFYKRETETAKLRSYACEWVKELKDRGYGVYILSNFGEIAWQTAKEMGALDFLPYTDGQMVSYMIHEVKPNPVIFEALFEKYGLKREECVFIDDTIKNVKGAEAIGLKAIQFTSFEETKKTLQSVLKPRMTKDIVPSDFSLTLALVDAIPVIFFGLNMILIGQIFNSVWFLIGALLCLIGGAGKVLWKVVVVIAKKNIWPLFVQMRILMPAGFLLMLLSLFIDHAKVSFSGIWRAFTGFPSVLFFLIGIFGMCLMIVFAKKLNSSDKNANWIEQLTNGIAQICFFVGLLLL